MERSAAIGASLLTWTMDGPNTVMTKLMGLMATMDKLVGRDFEAGLANLKSMAER